MMRQNIQFGYFIKNIMGTPPSFLTVQLEDQLIRLKLSKKHLIYNLVTAVYPITHVLSSYR